MLPRSNTQSLWGGCRTYYSDGSELIGWPVNTKFRMSIMVILYLYWWPRVSKMNDQITCSHCCWHFFRKCTVNPNFCDFVFVGFIFRYRPSFENTQKSFLHVKHLSCNLQFWEQEVNRIFQQMLNGLLNLIRHYVLKTWSEPCLDK